MSKMLLVSEVGGLAKEIEKASKKRTIVFSAPSEYVMISRQPYCCLVCDDLTNCFKLLMTTTTENWARITFNSLFLQMTTTALQVLPNEKVPLRWAGRSLT